LQWFFTGSDGQIKRKRKTHLKNADIFEAFCKRTNPASEIIACYLSPQPKDDGDGVQLCVEYLDQASLENFLYNRKKEECGILQKFVDPKGPHNNVSHPNPR